MLLVNDKQKKQIEKIAIHYSEPRQIAKGIEELSELSEVLARYLAKGGTYHGYKENLTEELADVIIMLNQIIFLEGVDEDGISDCITYKINRQLERINKEKLLNKKSLNIDECMQLQSLIYGEEGAGKWTKQDLK